MRRERLRPAHDAATLATIYSRPHRSSTWNDHNIRVDVTIALGRGLLADLSEPAVADLSCGDARIARALTPAPVLGDFAPGYLLRGPIEETIELLADRHVDAFVLSETLEHLDDPEAVLAKIRPVTDGLILSTPVEAWNDLPNLEHYWAWDAEAVEAMLVAAGFEVRAYNALDLRRGFSPYCFGIWVAR